MCIRDRPKYNAMAHNPDKTIATEGRKALDIIHGFNIKMCIRDSGSTDHSWQVIEKLRSESDNVKGIKFRRNYGKSPALYCGFEKAQGLSLIHICVAYPLSSICCKASAAVPSSLNSNIYT